MLELEYDFDDEFLEKFKDELQEVKGAKAGYMAGQRYPNKFGEAEAAAAEYREELEDIAMAKITRLRASGRNDLADEIKVPTVYVQKETPAPFVFEVALWMEFGTYNSPARSFMRPVLDNPDEILKFIKIWADYGHPLIEIAKMLAELLKNEIKRNIYNGSDKWEANSDLTIWGGPAHNKKSGKPFFAVGKNSTKPLVNTGKLMQSVQGEIIT